MDNMLPEIYSHGDCECDSCVAQLMLTEETTELENLQSMLYSTTNSSLESRNLIRNTSSVLQLASVYSSVSFEIIKSSSPYFDSAYKQPWNPHYTEEIINSDGYVEFLDNESIDDLDVDHLMRDAAMPELDPLEPLPMFTGYHNGMYLMETISPVRQHSVTEVQNFPVETRAAPDTIIREQNRVEFPDPLPLQPAVNQSFNLDRSE
ncbi:hypothetical protein EDC01DRAFT_635044 [Geopyxis carbonaria]|nr:hypothetical protein EDC01DRAFT_635044 [Geopyxis carbonaria]